MDADEVGWLKMIYDYTPSTDKIIDTSLLMIELVIDIKYLEAAFELRLPLP